MIVQDFDPYDDDPTGIPVARSALTHGTVADAVRAYDLTRANWPVSGDATTRAGTIIHRKK